MNWKRQSIELIDLPKPYTPVQPISLVLFYVCVFNVQTFVLALYRVSIRFPWIVFHFGFYHLRCAFVGFLSNLWINWQTFRLTAVNRFHYYSFLSLRTESNASQWTISLFILPFDFFFSSNVFGYFPCENDSFQISNLSTFFSFVPVTHALSTKASVSAVQWDRQRGRNK